MSSVVIFSAMISVVLMARAESAAVLEVLMSPSLLTLCMTPYLTSARRKALIAVTQNSDVVFQMTTSS